MKMSRATIKHRLHALGLELPSPPAPVGAYVPAVRTGRWIFTSGQLPLLEGRLTATGKVPGEVSIEAAQAAARQAAINALAAVQGVLGSLDNVEQVVRLTVFVNSSAGFTDQAKVANSASELLGAVFGDNGVHARSAVGAAELPLSAPVELELVVTVEDEEEHTVKRGPE
jgi:enamine deaminase RidA (YjgF/YER057c/UK114 family)